jgi:hypothetical protein
MSIGGIKLLYFLQQIWSHGNEMAETCNVYVRGEEYINLEINVDVI